MKILVLSGMMIALLAASCHLVSLDRVERFAGVVTATSAESITLASSPSSQDNGRAIRIVVQRSTLFLQDGKSVSFSDLKIGTPADVDAATDGQEAYAINIAFDGPSGSRGVDGFVAPVARRE